MINDLEKIPDTEALLEQECQKVIVAHHAWQVYS